SCEPREARQNVPEIIDSVRSEMRCQAAEVLPVRPEVCSSLSSRRNRAARASAQPVTATPRGRLVDREGAFIHAREAERCRYGGCRTSCATQRGAMQTWPIDSDRPQWI